MPSATPATPPERLTLGGQAAVSFGTGDEEYFNYSSYDYDMLRLFRLDGSADLRVNRRLSLLGDLRVMASADQGHWHVGPYALFARVRPWPDRAVDIQAGLIPPVFGAFSRRAYETDNPLIGYPLGYQYLTSLRADALPRTVWDLLAMRGQGWWVRYPIGATAAASGTPVVDAVRYQSGVEVHAGTLQPLEASAAWTSGALATPGYARGNGGRQVSGRVAARPLPGLVLGASASRGSFVSRALLDREAPGSPGDQRALGFDAEYSRDHWLVRTEGIWSSWRIPLVLEPPGTASLSSFAVDLEGRYRISPRVYAAARVGRLDFSNVAAPGGPTPWEWPVRRVQVGGGVYLWRNALVKVEWQQNRREAAGSDPYGSADRPVRLIAAQLVAWF